MRQPHALAAMLLFAGVVVPPRVGLAESGDTPPPVELSPVTIEGDLGEFRSELTAEVNDGVRTVKLRLQAESPAELQPIELKFDFPSVDIAGYWNSEQNLDKVNYYRCGFTSRASGAAPVLCFYNNRLQNRITVSASDALNPLKFNCGVKEEDVKFYGSIKLFTEKLPPTTEYEITLRIDTRPVAYHQSLAEVSRWWETFPEYRPASTPDIARRPMYSTWYSYHQSLNADQLVKECRIAKGLGCEAIIVDDGWQTQDSNRGYAYTGDWRPERITDMKGFVRRAHDEGVKVVLWYSLPFIGGKAENYERFEGKYLHYWASQDAYVLDPRYPEVRDHIVDTYATALQEWDLDGFKLDFIGWFRTYSDTKLTVEDGRDYASVGAATDRLMTDISKRLLAIRPDVMIEFRQPYVGPVMRKYGNMFRGVDCPNNAGANRNEIANLRLLSGGTAVHSDMFIWREEEPTESAALQLLNILFSVPQVSVRLEEIPAAHKAMVRHWLAYWNENRSVLLDGEFLPGNPGANYPTLTGLGDGKQITALYETALATQQSDDVQRMDVINASGEESVVLEFTRDWGPCRVTVYDTAGEEVSSQVQEVAAGPRRFPTPRSGLLRVEAQ